MVWVLDCSFALALVLPDESSAAIRDFFSSHPEDDTLWVPGLWWYEIANVLTVAERKRRIHRADALKAVNLFSALKLETDHAAGERYAGRLIELAHGNKISAYDAAYIELAQRKKAHLATLDLPLRDAARACGLETWQP